MGELRGVEPDIGDFGRLARRMEVFEIFKLARVSRGYGIARFANLEQRVDEYLDEPASPTIQRAMSRSARKVEANEAGTIKPASSIVPGEL